jgi:DNA-binding CsgD family transcriptional regulator
MDAASLSELLDALYAAAVEPERWPNFLTSLNGAFRGGGATLFVEDPRSGQVDFIVEGGFEPGVVAAYSQYYSTKNIWIRSSLEAPSGTIVTGHAAVDPADLVRTEFYNDWLRPNGLFDAVGCILTRTARGPSANISVLRRKEAGLYDDEEIASFRSLMPHVLRAVQLNQRLVAAQVQAGAALQSLQDLNVALVLSDRAARVLFANPLAEDLLRRKDGLLATAGILRATTPSATQAMHRLIAQAGGPAPRANGSGGVLSLPRGDGRRPLSALICPTRFSLPILPATGPAALLLLSDPERSAPVPEERLIQLHGLTPAEARLLAALARGDSLQDYADMAGISINTVKVHLRRVLDKTDCRRQSDLVRLVLSDFVTRTQTR